ncbi:hypothetical protein ACLBWZ_04640 [Brucellaceae bacterium C25G]
MPHLILQLAFLIAVVFIIGSLLGAYVRKQKTKNGLNAAELEKPVEESKSVPQKTAVAAPIPAVPEQSLPLSTAPDIKSEEQPSDTVTKDVVTLQVKPDVVLETEAAVDDDLLVIDQPADVQEPVHIVDIDQPTLLDVAKDGKPDDLLKIKGIGPTLQRKLYALGVYHFEQLAGWNANNAVWIGKQLNFPGRVEREEWVEQARSIIEIADKEHAQKSAKKPAAKKSAINKVAPKSVSVKAAVKKAPLKAKKSKVKPIQKKTIS